MDKYELKHLPYWNDIKPILESGPKRTSLDIQVKIHTATEDLQVLRVDILDDRRDYVANIGDEILLTVQMGLGDYAKRLYPSRNNLEVSIKYKYQSMDAKTSVISKQNFTVRYKAVFDDVTNKAIEATSLAQYDIQTLNNQEIVPVHFQLLDRALEILRFKTTEGIVRNVEPGELIISTLVTESSKLMIDGKPAVDAVDMVTARNTDLQPHISIPSKTLVADLPSFLQERVCGVYQHAIGTYLQHYRNMRTWFVYPLYDNARFTQSRPKVAFYSLNEREFQGVDRTYKEEGDLLSVLVTSGFKYSDNADNDTLNKGSGFRMADPKAITKKPVKMTEEGPEGVRTKLNREVVHNGRDDGATYAPRTDRKLSSNPYLDYSRIMMRSSSQVDLIWDHGDIRLLYPGMPCRFFFLEKNKVRSLDGTVLLAQQLITPTDKNFLAKHYSARVAVSIAVTARKVEQQPVNQETYGRFE